MAAMKNIRPFLIFALILFSSVASAQSAGEMLSACRPVAQAELSDNYVRFERTFASGMCWGAFLAIQSAIVWANADGSRLFAVCAPTESKTTQLVAVFIEYAQRNPQRHHEPFFEVAIASLRTSFPCSVSR